MQAEAKYPEHEKLSKVKDESQAIGEFLDWLKGGFEGSPGYQIGSYHQGTHGEAAVIAEALSGKEMDREYDPSGYVPISERIKREPVLVPQVGRKLEPTDEPRTKSEALEMALKWQSGEWSNWNRHANPENQTQAYVTCAQHDAAEIQKLAALHSMLPDEDPS